MNGLPGNSTQFRIPRATIGIIVFLWVWYLFELFVNVYLGTETSKWLFYARPGFSPGWVLAPISHRLSKIQHIGGNTILLALFGYFVEGEFYNREYVKGFIGITFLSTLIPIFINILLSNGDWFVVGSSGGVAGVIGMYCMSRGSSDILSHLSVSPSSRVRQFLTGFLIVGFLVVFLFYMSGNQMAHASGLVLGATFSWMRNRTCRDM